MPKYKTHLTAGFLTFLILFLILEKLKAPLNYTYLYVTSCLFGSLFPDIDTKSLIQRVVYIFIFITFLIALILKKWIFVSFLGIISLIPMIVNHRRLTHRIWFIILAPFVLLIVIYNYDKKLIIPSFLSYVFFVSGAISHIWLDFGFKRKIIKKRRK